MSTPEQTQLVEDFIQDVFNLFSEKGNLDKEDYTIYFDADTAPKFVHLLIIFLRKFNHDDTFILG